MILSPSPAPIKTTQPASVPGERRTIRLLLIEGSHNEAERVVTLFRNAGNATRVHRLTSPEDLDDALQQSWDLLICSPNSEDMDPLAAIETIARQAKDIPVLLLVEGNDPQAVTEALRVGAQDAVPQGDDERLLRVATRELANLEERRARRHAELALRESEKRAQTLLDSAVDAIAYVHDGMHVYANPAYLKRFGYADLDDLAGIPIIDLVEDCDGAEFRELLRNAPGQAGGELQCSGVDAQGQRFPARMVFSQASFDGEPCVQVVIRGHEESADLQAQIREISRRDPVTGLYNRSHFLELIDTAVEKVIKGGKPASLALIGIDHYSTQLNEIGLAQFDQLLADLAVLLRQHFSPDTELARFRDGVFAALEPGCTPQQSEPRLRELLRKVEGQVFEVAGRSVQITLSIGAAGVNERTPQARTIIERAHRCLEQVRNGIKLFDPTEELAAAANRGDVTAMIRQALERNAFRLLFQPIISLRGDTEEQYDVLLRLLDPQGEEVPPGQFIQAAVENGLAGKIDRWVILNSVKLLAEHRSKGNQTRLFVHLTAASLREAGLLGWIGAALRAARLPADALVFQLHEQDAIAQLKQARLFTEGLGQIGCKIAISQFGCSLNPFNTLRHLNVDYVKLDGSFASQLDRKENQDILKEMLGELRAQGKQSIVPFVDSASLLAMLWQAGANYIQGYYLQGPSLTMDYEFASEE